MAGETGKDASSGIDRGARGDGPRGVLLHRQGANLHALAESLGKHGVRLEGLTDPFRAVARVCVLSRSAAVVVVLVEPRQLARAAEAVRAIRRYAPRAVCWSFEAGRRPSLRAIDHDDLAGWERAASAVPQATSTAVAAAVTIAPGKASAWTGPSSLRQVITGKAGIGATGPNGLGNAGPRLRLIDDRPEDEGATKASTTAPTTAPNNAPAGLHANGLPSRATNSPGTLGAPNETSGLDAPGVVVTPGTINPQARAGETAGSNVAQAGLAGPTSLNRADGAAQGADAGAPVGGAGSTGAAGLERVSHDLLTSEELSVLLGDLDLDDPAGPARGDDAPPGHDGQSGTKHAGPGA
jgi:hypothetical protein